VFSKGIRNQGKRGGDEGDQRSRIPGYQRIREWKIAAACGLAMTVLIRVHSWFEG